MSKSGQTYKKNIKALREIHPNIAAWIESAEPVSWVEETPEGLIFRLSSQPLTCDKNTERFDANVKLYKQACTVMIGIGSGDLLQHALRKKEAGHIILVVEPVAYLVRLALDSIYVAKAVKDRELFICSNVHDAQYMLSQIESTRAISTYALSIEPYVKVNPEHMNALRDIHAMINQMACNTGTVVGSGERIVMNDVESMPYCILPRGVKELSALYKGSPAVIVSTGPSLARNIHILKDMQDQVIIVAVGQALRILLAHGIRPDLICSVDFGEVNWTHYEGLLDSDVPLAILNRAYAPLLREYRGPKFIASEGAIHGILADKGHTIQGGSVAHMALGLAHHMGCNPLIMVGQDLALGELSHTPQADSMGKVEVKDGSILWKVDDPRSHKLNQAEHSMGAAIKVAGWYGEPVLTNVGLASFITAFENIITVLPDVEVINATEGGARIKGAKHRFLSTIAERNFPTIRDKRERMQPLLSPDPKAQEIAEKAVEALTKDIEKMVKLRKHCENALAAADRVAETIEKSPTNKARIERGLADNRDESLKAQKIATTDPIFGAAIFGARRKIVEREMDIKGDKKHLLKNHADLLKRLDRNRFILNAAKDMVDKFTPVYEQSLALIKQYHESKDQLVLGPREPLAFPNLDDAEKYFELGNWVRPFMEAVKLLNTIGSHQTGKAIIFAIIEKAERMRLEDKQAALKIQQEDRENKYHLLPEYLELIEQAQELGRMGKDFEKSLAMLEKALELLPERYEARWGVASCHFRLRDFSAALEHYKKLMEVLKDDAARLKTIRFELSQTLLMLGEVERGAEMYEKLVEEDAAFAWAYRIVYKSFLERGDKAKAVECLKKYLKFYPQDATFTQVLAEVKKGLIN